LTDASYRGVGLSCVDTDRERERARARAKSMASFRAGVETGKLIKEVDKSTRDWDFHAAVFG